MSPKVTTDIFHRRTGLNPPEAIKQTAIGQIQPAQKIIKERNLFNSKFHKGFHTKQHCAKSFSTSSPTPNKTFCYFPLLFLPYYHIITIFVPKY